MGRLGDRLGKFDDESAIYTADDPAQEVHWRRVAVAYVVGSALAALLILGADLLFGQPVGALAVIALTVVLTLYIVWRRRRNERLTGSATTWPSHEGG